MLLFCFCCKIKGFFHYNVFSIFVCVSFTVAQYSFDTIKGWRLISPQKSVLANTDHVLVCWCFKHFVVQVALQLSIHPFHLSRSEWCCGGVYVRLHHNTTQPMLYTKYVALAYEFAPPTVLCSVISIYVFILWCVFLIISHAYCMSWQVCVCGGADVTYLHKYCHE